MGNNKVTRSVLIFITLATAVFFVISPSISTADVAVTGTVMVQGHLLTPPITVIPTPNVTYKATTFNITWNVENGTITNNYYNFTGVLRVHVNWNETTTGYFWNILELINNANYNGNFTVEIFQYAKMGPSYVNNTTSDLVVYIDHNWQTTSNPGMLLKDNVSNGPLPLYPSSQVSYYLGVNYTDPFADTASLPSPPPLPPPPMPAKAASPLPLSKTPNDNSLGEYVYFNFVVKF